MKLVAVSQRVVVDRRDVRNDALDQRWWPFLDRCGLAPVPVPNDTDVARKLVDDVPVDGIVLTGGNDLGDYGGDATERDATESMLVDTALERDLPLLGVCRGMQLLLHRFGIELERVHGHVAEEHAIDVEGGERVVNSYHDWAARDSRPPLHPWATTPDDVVEAVEHESAPLMGIMWHPERAAPFAREDVTLFREHFGVSA